jgi:hypothetical protein
MPTRRTRRLAAPIVVTFAAVPACAPEPATNPPTTPHVDPTGPILNPPPPHPTAAPTTIATPEVPIGNPPPPQLGLPFPVGNGEVRHLPDGTCVQYPDMSASNCPPGAHCNPPPPHPVRCPGGRASAP